MRLFVAIKFDENVEKELVRQINFLKKATTSGNFSSVENLHMTFAFIGESQKLTEIKAVLDGVTVNPFELKIDGNGRFGSTYWIGAKGNDELSKLVEQLRNGFTKAGIDFDRKPFVPHVTIARNVVSDGTVKLNTEPTVMRVKSIHLMRSDRINNVIRYKAIYTKELFES